MDWSNVLSAILGNAAEAFGAILAIVIIYVSNKYIIPWLKQKELYSLVKTLMAAAESTFKEAGSGQEKKDWVFQSLDALGITYDAAALSKLIDGFTRELTAAGVINTDE